MDSVVIIFVIVFFCLHYEMWQKADKKNKKKYMLFYIALIIGTLAARIYIRQKTYTETDISGTSFASYYTDGYHCGWNDRSQGRYFYPERAANEYYIGIDEEIYRKVSDEFAAAFSAGYGFGYYDYPTGKEIHRTEYTKLGHWHSK